MNAQLKPIEMRVATRPEYDNTYLGWERDWITHNVALLRAWWDECNAELGEPGPEADFPIFCACQHDVQLSIRDEFKRTLRQY